MKLNTMQLNVDKEARKFIVTTVGACVAVWGVAFELGVWGEIFYRRLFNIWVVSLAVLLTLLVLPNAKAPVSWLGKLALAFPTAWIILTFLNDQVLDLTTTAWVAFFAGLVISVLCLPYFIYVLVSLLDREALSLGRGFLSLMIVIVLIVGVIGYTVGRNNRYFMTCHDFEIVGDHVPDNCVERQ
jgi:hypothetical protein